MNGPGEHIFILCFLLTSYNSSRHLAVKLNRFAVGDF